MRYAATHKQQSRERILEVAARQFRSRGPENVGVADVMGAAGMTIGGFYKHFANKDQLLQEAIGTALRQVSARLNEIAANLPREEALKRVIGMYLSEQHVQHPDLGCALAAMGTEIARMPRERKRIVNQALDAYADQLQHLMPGETGAQRRAAFNVLFASMAGCIMTARAQTSKQRQSQILATGRMFLGQVFCGKRPPEFLEKVQ